MFPQSELDNYKLQVELLQEKLQRSEISRQHLERKLEKVLQRREEHEKLVRSKAKQKYQQFLEDQQRRNERNKQLVQMLERIEQQTEIMNARSERLKMMKLQYEMYFAKLVHSQTRRCIQSSIATVVPLMTTTSIQPMTQNTMPGIQQADMEGYDYITPTSSSMMAAYQGYSTIPNFEKDQQTINMPYETMDMPTLANFKIQNRDIEMDKRSVEKAPVGLYEPCNAINENNVKILHSDKENNNDMDLNHLTKIEFNTNRNLAPATHLLPEDKELADSQDSVKPSVITSSAFDEISNVKMMSQMQEANNSDKCMPKMDSLSKQNLSKTSYNNKENLKQLSTSIKPLQKTLVNINENNENISERENGGNSIEKPYGETPIANENTSDIIKEPLTSSLKTGQIKTTLKTLPNSAVSTQNLKSDINENLKLPNVQLNTNTEANSSSTKMSIENIENAIYGELLNPLGIEPEQKQEINSPVPKLLENLVTQPVTIEEENNASLKDDSRDKIDTKLADGNFKFEDNFSNENKNIEPNAAYEEYSNTQQNESNSAVEYDTYENTDSSAVIENQQEQQYDYSNYDPTQYSYPGYIYDETTGEYKPDPNAAAEHYATDQQYAAEDYGQQYQQQNAYDYEQSYAPNQTSNIDNTGYDKYESTLMEDTSKIANSDSNADQQNTQKTQQSDLESQLQQPLQDAIENSQENISELPTKITKPTSILSTADKNDNQKKKKRVNFVDSSEADESVTDKEAVSKLKPSADGSSESDFNFSSSSESETKTT